MHASVLRRNTLQFTTPKRNLLLAFGFLTGNFHRGSHSINPHLIMIYFILNFLF